MTEEGKRLLILKGVPPEDVPEPKVDSAQILDEYRMKKVQAEITAAELNALRKRAFELLIERLERMR